MANERPSGNEVVVLQDNRVFVQYGGARPNLAPKYYGRDTNYAILQGVTIPSNGTVTPHWVGDPRVAGKFRLVRRTVGAPPLAAATLHMLEKRGNLNKLLAQDCGFTAYLVDANCGDPSNFVSGWENGKIEVYADAIMGSINGGNRSDWSNNTPVINQVPVTLREIYEIGTVGFGTIMASDIAVEVLDVAFGNVQRCAGCGRANNGSNWQYGVQTYTGSNEACVIYRITDEDGAVIRSGVVDITGIGASQAPTGIDVAGEYLIVIVGAENAYYYALIDQVTGVPGAFTKVTTGFVATKLPQDLYVVSDHEIYMAANGGYVYKLASIGAAVTVLSAGDVSVNNLNRINGFGDTLVAAGASGTVLVSTNRGLSWAATDAAPSADAIQGLDVRDDDRFWVCTSGGELYYTLDAGATWTEAALTDTPTNLKDVVFVNDEVGWVGGTDGSAGLIWATWDGGATWTPANDAPRMLGVPAVAAFQRANRIAVPYAANTEVAANTVLVGGLGATTDGIMLFGTGTWF